MLCSTSRSPSVFQLFESRLKDWPLFLRSSMFVRREVSIRHKLNSDHLSGNAIDDRQI